MSNIIDLADGIYLCGGDYQLSNSRITVTNFPPCSQCNHFKKNTGYVLSSSREQKYSKEELEWAKSMCPSDPQLMLNQINNMSHHQRYPREHNRDQIYDDCGATVIFSVYY